MQRFYHNVQTRALDPHAPLQELNPAIMKYLEPNASIFQNEGSQSALAEFEKQFETKLIPRKEIKVCCATKLALYFRNFDLSDSQFVDWCDASMCSYS